MTGLPWEKMDGLHQIAVPLSSFFFLSFSTLSHGLFFILPFACRYCFLVCFYVVHGGSTPKRGRGDDEIDGDGGCG